MTISYSIGPNPIWYIADLVGRPLGGGYMATFRSFDKTAQKFVYQDQGGTKVWPYENIPNVGKPGILFNENGQQGPFYWEVDSSNLAETYYIEVYDSSGGLVWAQDNYLPGSGAGGGNVTTAYTLDNLVTNSVMWRNCGTSITPLPELMVVAPGAHAGFAQTASNAGPDILFIKNNTDATDQITFPTFTLGDAPFTGDITPVDYCEYSCTNSPTGEAQKDFQFPITAKVQNLSNQNVTITLWAKSASSSVITLYWRQFFGDGSGASINNEFPIDTITLSPSWGSKIVLPNKVIPNVSGKALGACHNDALFLLIRMPLNQACTVSFQEPSVYLGNIAPGEAYQTYDSIDAVLNVPRTGDVRTSYIATTSVPPGFLLMNDGTIGNPSSSATNRANFDTFPLYNLLWNGVSNTYAPVSTGRGATSILDFEANKTLTLTRQLGRMLAGTGSGSGLTARTLGEYVGSETISIAAMPAHNHPGSTVPFENVAACRGGGGADTVLAPGPGSVTVAQQGGGTLNVQGAADGNMPPVTFMNVYIKL